jgi:hypothetical protein
MPRRSAASLSVPVFETPRPEPPARLSQEAQQVWSDTVAGFRADWFQGAEDVLEAYVQDVVLARQLVAELASARPVASAGSNSFGCTSALSAPLSALLPR